MDKAKTQLPSGRKEAILTKWSIVSMAKGARRKVIKVPLSKVRDNFSEFIKKASKEEIVVTVHGRPAAVIIGFEDEEGWLEHRLLKDEKFLARVAKSRQQYQEGKYKTLEELP